MNNVRTSAVQFILMISEEKRETYICIERGLQGVKRERERKERTRWVERGGLIDSYLGG